MTICFMSHIAIIIVCASIFRADGVQAAQETTGRTKTIKFVRIKDLKGGE